MHHHAQLLRTRPRRARTAGRGRRAGRTSGSGSARPAARARARRVISVDRGVDVVEDRHDRDPDPPVRRLRAEVGEPSVVRLAPGQRQLRRRPGAATEARSRTAMPAIRPVPSTSASGKSTSAATPSSSRTSLRTSESYAAVSPPSPPVICSHLLRNSSFPRAAAIELAHAAYLALVVVERFPVLRFEVLAVVRRGRSGVAVRRDERDSGLTRPPRPSPSLVLSRSLSTGRSRTAPTTSGAPGSRTPPLRGRAAARRPCSPRSGCPGSRLSGTRRRASVRASAPD